MNKKTLVWWGFIWSRFDFQHHGTIQFQQQLKWGEVCLKKTPDKDGETNLKEENCPHSPLIAGNSQIKSNKLSPISFKQPLPM